METQPNPNKTEVCTFLINNRQNTSKHLILYTLTTTLIQNIVVLHWIERCFFKTHIAKTAKKVKSRVNLTQKLAETSWGDNAATLRTATMAIVNSGYQC